MNVLVIGAHGRTGRRVTQLLSKTKHQPVAMIRDSSQREVFDDMGLPTVLGDLEYPMDHVFKAFGGFDAVVFAAGSVHQNTIDKVVLIDHIGVIRAATAAAMHGARRFVLLSAMNADEQSKSEISYYHRAKGFSDRFVREIRSAFKGEDLDWTIIHPGGLNDNPGTGKVKIIPTIHGNGTTCRDDLAATIVASLDHKGTIGKSFAVLEGDTPLTDALNTL
jgi:nucleoside-diphosphate-sugar epimerase